MAMLGLISNPYNARRCAIGSFFEGEEDAWRFLMKCDKAGRILD